MRFLPLLLSLLILPAGRHDPPDASLRLQEIPCQVLRYEYVVSPSIAGIRIQEVVSGSPDGNSWSHIDLAAERTIEALDEYCRQQGDGGFLQDNPDVLRLLDSLRWAYVASPVSFGRSQLDHLEHVSSIANQTRFVRRNADLLEALDQARIEFFTQPDSFSGTRLSSLDRVSLEVSSLPFLAGSPALTAELERVRMKLAESPEFISDARREELDRISRLVTGKPLMGAGLRLGRWALLVVTAILALLAGYYLRGLSDRSRSGAQISRHLPSNRLAQACVLLGVDIDCDAAELGRAYRSRQKQYHPDRVAHLADDFQEIAEEKSRELNEAYEFLKSRMGS